MEWYQASRYNLLGGEGGEFIEAEEVEEEW